MGLKQHTRARIEENIAKRTNFQIGNISGKHVTKDQTLGMGRLPEPYKSYLASVSGKSDMYVVYDYSTPIAWISDESDIWVIPTVQYSNTTTHHQGVIAVAITRNGENYTNL